MNAFTGTFTELLTQIQTELDGKLSADERRQIGDVYEAGQGTATYDELIETVLNF
tara:strand:- start:3622 stop:3786 length:165 start_codon:yes stop_codon:yes gene_type:complete